jgi:hypothetical protein
MVLVRNKAVEHSTQELGRNKVLAAGSTARNMTTSA